MPLPALVSNAGFGGSELCGVLAKQERAMSTGEVTDSEWVLATLCCSRDRDDVTVLQEKLLNPFGSFTAEELKPVKEHAPSAPKAGPGWLGFTCRRLDNTGLVSNNPETCSAEAVTVDDGADKPDEPDNNRREVPEAVGMHTGNADVDVTEIISVVEGICPWNRDDTNKLTGMESDSEIFDQAFWWQPRGCSEEDLFSCFRNN